MKKNNGFTLIEILVVMGIIAVLAAIVLIAINPARQFAQARNTQRESNVNAILNAIGQYIADNQGELPSGVVGGSHEIAQALCDDIVPEYLPALPTDPGSDSEGEPIADSDGDGDCDAFGANDVEYEVGTTTASARVEICAPLSDDEPALPDADEICVTR